MGRDDRRLMASETTCLKCGSPLTGDARQGFCPKCLFAQAAASGFEEPSISGPLDSKVEADAASQELPRTFGDYELLEEIARGGMGIVYKVRHVSLDRIVAVKMLLLGPLSSPEFVKRFRAEASAAASLLHANIVAIHEVGVHQGQQYFAMDYVEGQSLAKLLGNGPLPARRAAGYLKTIAEAIHYAHERGILHRDLKPSNVLIDANDQPRVTDFGLARRLEGDSELTVTGQVLGSPNYMPPEQAVGRRGKVSRRSDVYSLGAMLYHLLTGRPPFVGEGLTDTLEQVLNSEPVSPRLLNPSAPRDLETICLKCLEKEPDKRYPTAQALAEELSRFLRGEPVEARPVNHFEKAWRWCRRNPKTAILSAAVILLLLTVAIGSTLAAIRIKRAERAATEELFHSYVAQARAVRHNGREGQRSESLEVVVKAAVIRSSLELRSEAIACLAVTDVRFRDSHESPNPENESWDALLERRAYSESDGRIRVRRLADNSEVALLPSLGTGVQWLGAISPGGAYLAVWYLDGREVLWDVQKQQPVITNLVGSMCVDFSADGQNVAVSCQDGQLRRFGLNPVHSLPSLAINRVYGILRLSPQGDWAAGWEDGKTNLEVLDLRDGSLLRTLPHSSHVGSFAWSSNGRDLAVGCKSGRIVIWDALTGEKKNEFKAHQDLVISVGFSHSGLLLGSSSWDGEFRLWDLAADRLLLTALGNSYQVSFSADDRRIGYIQRGRETGLLEVTTSSIFHRLNCQGSLIHGAFSADVSPDGRLVAVAFSDAVQGVHIWADQQRDEPFFLPAGTCYSAIFTPDGTNLITCGPSGLARWPISRVQGATTDELHIGPRQAIRDGLEFNYAALSTDGRWVAAAYPDARAVSVYEVYHPTNRFSLVSQPRPQFPAISPDGRWVAVGNFKESGAKVWDFESKRVVCDIPTPSSALVTFSPDNRWLAISGEAFELWETGSWKPRYTIHRTRAGTTSLAFSPDAQTLAIGSEPGVIRLVATDTREVLADLEAPGDAIISYLRFSADGSQLFAVEWDQQVQVWDLRRMRAELRKLNLDWSTSPIPAEIASARPAPKPLRIVMEEHPR
jgi:WD40 repeat protein/predicted Ser/Thr protein kinase